MEFQKRKLLKKHKEVINELLDMIEEGEFYLAGGTALYYFLNHRYSVDLDFFTKNKKDFREYRTFFSAENIKLLSEDTIHAKVKGINVSFFLFSQPLLRDLLRFDIVKIASLEDILCMKVNAIIGRGSKKDFIDVYFIMKKLNPNPGYIIELFQKKFGNYSDTLIKKALTFFDDAEKEPEIPLIKETKWKDVKNFFIKNFARI